MASEKKFTKIPASTLPTSSCLTSNETANVLTAAELKSHYQSIEATPYAERQASNTVYQLLTKTADNHGDKSALSFQLTSDPKSKVETLNWRSLQQQITQCANMFHALGVGKNDVIALLLPSQNETVITLLGAMTTGIVAPINPLLEVEQIVSLLQETHAKLLVTLAPFPKTDLAQKAHAAVAHASTITTIVEIDLAHYLPKYFRIALPLLRPKLKRSRSVRTIDFHQQLHHQNADKLDFDEANDDRFCAYFHTGGTTGSPKIAQHRHSGIIYNGWISTTILFSSKDIILCPLPLFHVFAAYPVWIGCIYSGAHMVIPTPSGYRGDGVLDNFWNIIKHWRCTAFITVPTAATMLTQRPVNADISSVDFVISGSAPFPKQQLEEFKSHINAKVLEGYGMTEATCLISCNPPNSLQKTGSVGAIMPYTGIRILRFDNTHRIIRECAANEIGEICILSPGVNTGKTYLEDEKNLHLYSDSGHVRSGDLGRIDEDGYLWITGRAKDLIIRGGHNIDPAMIEDALVKHPAVSLVGAIGQPDRKSGEVPCAYVELVVGATTSEQELYAFAEQHIPEQASVPKHIEILEELPKTAIGKIYKPVLRELAIIRCYNTALIERELPVRATHVAKDERYGLVVEVEKLTSQVDGKAVDDTLGDFTFNWRFR